MNTFIVEPFRYLDLPMQQIFKILRNIIRSFSRCPVSIKDKKVLLRDCLEAGQEIEFGQLWFDGRSEHWKKRLQGRLFARMLYRACILLAAAEQHL